MESSNVNLAHKFVAVLNFALLYQPHVDPQQKTHLMQQKEQLIR
jgi:hypothetical protein